MPLSRLSHRNTSIDSELPSYSRAARTDSTLPEGRTDHVFYLVKGGRQWLTLAVRSRAIDANSTPSFAQGHVISGSVRIDLHHEVVIRSITISVIGELSSSTDVTRFLTITRQLYVSDVNEAIPSSDGAPVVHTGKLKGIHTWPYTIKLPKGVSIVLSNRIRNNFRLPPSLSDRESKGRIQYHLVVRVKKGTLSTGHRLVTPFEFTPLVRPSQPSIVRQISYLEGSTLVGPDGDSEGWKSFETLKITGTIFNARSVEVTCTLSVSKPLCYTRGSVMHLSLTIASPDAQAIDLLSSPSAPCVQLLRHATFSRSISVTAVKVIGPWDSDPEVVSTAMWWPAPSFVADSVGGRKILHGEIRIPDNLYPNCRILNFQLEYLVAFLPFKAVAFAPAVPIKTPLLTEKVEIVTVHAEGPRPVPYSLPIYAAHSS